MNAPLSAGLSAGLSATTLTWAAVIAALAAAGLARWLTLILITRATRLGLDDVPNHRSSHRRITPRGGGLAVVAATVIVLGAVAAAGLAAAPGPGWGLALLGCLGLAVVGLIDDMRSLGQRLRLICQAVAVALILHAGLLETSARGIALPLATANPTTTLIGWLWLAGLLLAGLWWINLFNFMDGIDGIAATQALFLLCSAMALLMIMPPSTGTAAGDGADLLHWFALLLAAALLGFLPANWSPARIFMGDAGSLFLGVSLLLVAMHSVTSGRINAWFWPIAAGSFICDASATLLRRLSTRQNVFSAHRSHFYQQLSRRWADHRRVTLVYSAINISWFLPLALLSHFFPRFGGALLVAAWVPAFIFLWRAGAGQPEPGPTAAGGHDDRSGSPGAV